MQTVKAFIIKENDKTLFVGLDTDLTIEEYKKAVKQAKENQEKEQEEKRLLKERIANLEQAIKDLRHEIKVDRGEE